MVQNVALRLAIPADLDFVRPDQGLSDDIVRHKIERQEIVVAEWQGTVVGCLHLEYLWSVVPYIALIWVVREYQRQGIGKALLRYTEAVLRDKGHDVLYSSSQTNEPEPQAWHRHMGFEECGVIAGINPGGVGEIFFRKRIV
jgi:N-acetylglutamate synthase-like GNAT family acetyltransferase